jgi:serine/threonine-protein kinase
LHQVSSNDTIATNSNSTTAQSSPLAGIQIAYPDEWLVNDLGNGTVRFSSPLRTDLMRFTVNVVNLPSSMTNMTLDNIVQLNLDTSKQQLSNFSLLESNATTISSENQSAYRIVYTNTNKDPNFPLKFKTMQIFTIKDGQLYTLSYVSEASQYGRYLPTIENMIDSVVFTNDTGLQTTENNDLMFSSNIIRM